MEEEKIGVNIVIERENVNGQDIFIASSPEVNVFSEGNSIDEAKINFIDGLKTHLKTFPDERKNLMRSPHKYEMPLLTKVFL